MSFTPTWWANSSYTTRTWRYAWKLYNFALGHWSYKGKYVNRYKQPRYLKAARAGDVIFYDPYGPGVSHAALVSASGPNGTLRAQHTLGQFKEIWSGVKTGVHTIYYLFSPR